MMRLQPAASAALVLFALVAVCADGSSLDVAAIARLHIPEWAVQQTGGGRELLQLVAGNLSNIPQQTVGFGDIRTPSPLPPVAANARVASLTASAAPVFAPNAVAGNERSAAVPAVPAQLKICSNSVRICAGSTPIKLHGVNWFGFETGNTFVDGLWQGPSALTLDFLDVLRRIKLLGFNTIRLPMSLKSLFEDLPRDFSTNCPYSGSNPTGAQIIASTKKPGLTATGGSITLAYTPVGSLPADGSSGRCNGYVPNTTVLARFLWTVGTLARNGFIVVIDQHLNTDTTLISNPTQWLQRWIKIVQEIQSDAYSRNRVIFDILNEPDAQGLRWEAQGSLPGMTNTYLSFMNAAYKINPAFLYGIEGLGQGSLGTNWGDGLATAQSVLQNTGASDPNPFFQALLKAPYRRNVIMMPHVYPPSISTVTSANLATAPGYYTRLSNSFGYLNRAGYCFNGACQRFPIVIGEFGSRLRDCRNRCASAGCMQLELQQQNNFIKYMNNVGDAADGKHYSIDGWIWWAWNANSGDTGGIVDDDWLTIIWQKISYLGQIGLQPWWYKSCGSTVAGCFSVLPISSPSGCGTSSTCSGSQSCANGYSCVNGKCCAAVSSCGNTCCSSSSPCVGGVCCPIARQCAGKCCPTGYSCYRGRCTINSALRKCGSTTCAASVACRGGACCGATQSCGKGRNTSCCSGTSTCLYYQSTQAIGCCAKAFSCGKYCCKSGETCTAGACCPAGRGCGSKCCPAGQMCSGGACVAARTVKKCGSQVCPTSVACKTNSSGCCSTAQSCGKGRNTSCCGGTTQCKYYPLTKAIGCCANTRICGSYCCTGTQKCVSGTCK